MVVSFKKIIAPVQMILLKKGICPGCGRPLLKGKVVKFKENEDKVICKCRRIFIFNKTEQRYRRALPQEV